MLLTKAGLELVEHLERQKDIASLLGSFQRVVTSFGMSGFCIGNPSPLGRKGKGGRWDGTWPAQWYQRYASLKLFSDDPTVARMNASPSAFRWSNTYAHATPRQRRVLKEIFDFGIQDGLAVPIHQGQGPIAGVSIGAVNYELAPQDETALAMASLYLHAKMSALEPANALLLPRRLTPRERECLQWVASGKTDWEISHILGISEQTAHGYMQNALVKLGARTRAQAVALAIQSAQIKP